jgi:hypothetical protein
LEVKWPRRAMNYKNRRRRITGRLIRSLKREFDENADMNMLNLLTQGQIKVIK